MNEINKEALYVDVDTGETMTYYEIVDFWNNTPEIKESFNSVDDMITEGFYIVKVQQ
jgi:hypothetical protein